MLAVLGALAVALYHRVKKPVREARDFRTLHIPDLGLTMADGGEKIDKNGASCSRN
jgi:hypothetical protein